MIIAAMVLPISEIESRMTASTNNLREDFEISTQIRLATFHTSEFARRSGPLNSSSCIGARR